MMTNDWAWWTSAVNGLRTDFDTENPPPGFFRSRAGEGVAVWYDEAGSLTATVHKDGRTRTITARDQIINGFAGWCMNPVAHDVYVAFTQSGRWPDAIDPPAERGIGDNMAGMEPNEAMLAEIADLVERFNAWLKTLPAGISNDTEDAKAANYAKALADLKKKAEDTHKTEKAPHLEAGRKVDAAWKPVISAADDAKRTILKPTTEYRMRREAEERAKREEEARRQRAERERIEAENRAKLAEDPAAPVTPPPPPPSPPKRPTGLRTVQVCKITDLPALAAQIAAMDSPPADFVDVCRTIARRMITAGVPVAGAQIVEEKRAA